MREEYDFTNARKNPYTQKLKKQITINIDSDTIQFFKDMANSSGIPYQTLINLTGSSTLVGIELAVQNRLWW